MRVCVRVCVRVSCWDECGAVVEGMPVGVVTHDTRGNA